MTMTNAEFYDDMYKGNPRKWECEDYDKLAFDILEKYYVWETPASLLDVGCGNGHTLEYFAKRWPLTEFTGLDISGEAIRLAQLRLPATHFINKSLREATFPDNYDCIILLGVAEHFEDLHNNLRYLRSLLNEDGICYLECPNCIAYPESEHIEGFRKTAVGTRQEEWHLFRPTWERYISEAGFEIVQSLNGLNQQTEFVWVVK